LISAGLRGRRERGVRVRAAGLAWEGRATNDDQPDDRPKDGRPPEELQPDDGHADDRWNGRLDALAETLRSPVNRLSLAYWRYRRGDRLMPARADIDPVEMAAFLPHIVLLDVERAPLNFRYRLMGTAVTYHTIADHTGKRLTDLPHQTPPSLFWSMCETLSGGGCPRSSGLPYVGPHKWFVSNEDVFMPLSSDGETVDMLFVTVDFFRKG